MRPVKMQGFWVQFSHVGEKGWMVTQQVGVVCDSIGQALEVVEQEYPGCNVAAINKRGDVDFIFESEGRGKSI
jgi:hypothetical protein